MIKANTQELLREKIVKLALMQHHKSYVHGNHGEDSFDCAGLVWFIYQELFNINLYKNGYGLSTTTKLMTSNYGKLILFNDNKDINIINKGDILFFHRQSMNDDMPKEDNRYPGHCGIYIGNNKFIHSLKSEGKVVISDFEKNDYWKKVLVASKDVISEQKY